MDNLSLEYRFWTISGTPRYLPRVPQQKLSESVLDGDICFVSSGILDCQYRMVVIRGS